MSIVLIYNATSLPSVSSKVAILKNTPRYLMKLKRTTSAKGNNSAVINSKPSVTIGIAICIMANKNDDNLDNTN